MIEDKVTEEEDQRDFFSPLFEVGEEVIFTQYIPYPKEGTVIDRAWVGGMNMWEYWLDPSPGYAVYEDELEKTQ